MNCVLKYPGAKWGVAPGLISFFQKHHAELREWYQETVITTDQLSQHKKEVLWMNFEPAKQLTIFDREGAEL